MTTRIIDFHTHVFPDEVAAKAIPALVAEIAGGHPTYYDGTVGGLLAQMDEVGISASVLAPVATKPMQVESVNDWTASQASERIVPFGAMHPDYPDPASEIARMRALGMRGFKMHPEYQEFEPHEERMDTIHAAARENDMIILYHAGVDIGIPTLRGTPESFARVLDEWSDLRIVLAHMGSFDLWDDVERLLVGRNVWFDTSYSLGHLPDEQFARIAREHGVERVLFGSDGPWTDPAAEMAQLRELFHADELAVIMGGNAAALLGMQGAEESRHG